MKYEGQNKAKKKKIEMQEKKKKKRLERLSLTYSEKLTVLFRGVNTH